MGTTESNTSGQLRISEGDPRIILHPSDNDLFVQTGKQVIDACKLNISIEVWKHELTAMFNHVVQWAQEWTAHIQSIHVAPRSTKTVVFISPTSDTFDFDLADEMANLNIHLLKTYNIGMVEILQIPFGRVG